MKRLPGVDWDQFSASYTAAQAVQKSLALVIRALFAAVQAELPNSTAINDYNAIVDSKTPMATITIRNMDDDLKARLRMRAASHGRSMEEEVRSILRSALETEQLSGQSLVGEIRALVEPFGGVDLELPIREPIADAPDFTR